MQAPSISEIEPGLFIGNAASSYDIPTLENNHINARVSLGNGKFGMWGTPRCRKLVPFGSSVVHWVLGFFNSRPPCTYEWCL